MWSSGQSAGVTLVEWEHAAHISALIEELLIDSGLDWTHNTECVQHRTLHMLCTITKYKTCQHNTLTQTQHLPTGQQLMGQRVLGVMSHLTPSISHHNVT